MADQTGSERSGALMFEREPKASEQSPVGADGKATFAVVQAEDELAAIGMVLGSGWAGARSMTTTSGPGISFRSARVALFPWRFPEIPSARRSDFDSVSVRIGR